MPAVLLLGDSQAGNPGAAAKQALEAQGYSVTQVHNDGQSPVAYVNTPSLWSQYTGLAAGKDIIVLIFGHNSPAGTATSNALIRMRDGVQPPVLMTGPPMYPSTANPTSSGQPSQTVGAALRDQNAGIFGSRYIDAWPSTPVDLARDAAGWHLTPASAQGWGQTIAAAVIKARAFGGSASLPFGLSPMAAATAALGTAAVGVIFTLLWQRR